MLGVRGRSKIDVVVIVAVIMLGLVVGVRQGRVPVRLFGATVRVME